MKEIIIYLVIIIIVSNFLFIASIVLSKWFRRWRGRNLRKGLINYLGLSDWYDDLTPEERETFKGYYSQISKENVWADSLTEGKIYSSSERPAQLLWMVAVSAVLNSDFQFARKALNRAQSICRSPWERQQVHTAFAFLYFRQRDLLAGAEENCISHCEAAIKSIEKYGTPENIPTLPFDYLITIYREKQRLDEAKRIAAKAIQIAGKRDPRLKVAFTKKLEDLKRSGVS
jgi:hypothetical protein